MFDEFDGNSFTILDDFITELLTSSFDNGRPISVDYLSIARFNPFSTIIPTEAQLNAALIDAFSGLNTLEYEVLLTVVFLQEASDAMPDTKRSGVGATGIAAAAVAVSLLIAGIVIYKRRNGGEEVEMDKLNKGGDVTVAGETFTGETYDGSASVSAASMEYSRRYQDEEDGTKNFNNLGTIQEDEDADSVTPGWQKQVDKDNKEVMGSSTAFRSGVPIGSFEEIALQGPTHGGPKQNRMMSPSSSHEDASLISESDMSLSVDAGKRNKFEIKSLPSYDSSEDKVPSIANALSIRDNSSRRPRTVAEIEALLSADLDRNSDDEPAEETEGNKPANRPRTVEEIESLLQADLADDATLELPFSDEDETINADDE
jgi:hypothetical protein